MVHSYALIINVLCSEARYMDFNKIYIEINVLRIIAFITILI